MFFNVILTLITIILFIKIFLIKYKRDYVLENSYNYNYIRSAFNQDILLYHLFFEKLKNYKGYYIELGAHDGYTSSNTYFFEKVLNWNGLLIESNPENCRKLKLNNRLRKNSIIICAPVCMSDYVSIEGNSYRSKISKLTNNSQLFKCRKLYDIIKEYYIRKIDYFCLDVEGSEFEVLKTFNFSIPVSYFMIEKGKHIKNCEELLYKNGYRRNFIFRSPTDNLYYKY